MTDKEKLFELILKLSDRDAERLLAHVIHEKAKAEEKAKPTYRRIIYSIKNNVTGKEYIGRTQDLDKRIKSHMATLRSGKHVVEDMQSDFDKYGDAFTITVLEEITEFAKNKREYELIESHESYIRDKGYNYNDTTFRRWKAAKERSE